MYDNALRACMGTKRHLPAIRRTKYCMYVSLFLIIKDIIFLRNKTLEMFNSFYHILDTNEVLIWADFHFANIILFATNTTILLVLDRYMYASKWYLYEMIGISIHRLRSIGLSSVHDLIY